MAKQFASIEPNIRAFIERQRIFFTGSAAAEGRVNVSPKGMDSFRVLGPNAACYLDLTGSGNETAALLRASPRLTIMFCAFEGAPMILRLYGQGRILKRGTPDYDALLAGPFGGVEPAGARHIVYQDIDLVQTSCGYAVPNYDYREDRQVLATWATNKGEDGLHAYRLEKNMRSMDGLPTYYVDEPDAAAAE
ncbi:pyridoxamine 5'-phosphate oxidase family protein [Zavarzinia sp. CC-PAN008]|uniref:pyridoxamine 5'-phosphate oxidase family protein n=1 Tax=Zavarzinia sp. CC-PAN008 TaxID=3243332 RepID=UPI003F74AB35